MNQAILITAYKDVESIIDLVRTMGDNFNYYVHIDLKSNLDISSLKNEPNIYVIKNYKVNWGGSNHFFAILDLCKEAIKNVNNNYFHLITAEDFPIKPISEILNINNQINYLDYVEFPFYAWDESGGFDRFEYHRFFDILNAKKKNHARILNLTLNLQKKLHLKRSKLGYENLFGGSTYWSLNRFAITEVLNTVDKNFINRLKHTFCAEEFVFQTILMNSSIKDSVVNDNLRYIDWHSKRGGDPAFLDESDLEILLNSNKIFARKILKNNSNKLLASLKEIVLKKSN